MRLTNGGHANSVERDSENGATWEVEVTKPDGTTVDVRLDEGYGLVVIENDSRPLTITTPRLARAARLTDSAG